jgi:methionyl-tRNA formyltransferase
MEILQRLLLNHPKENFLIFTTDDERNKDFLVFLNISKIKYCTEKINKQVEAVAKFHPDYLLSIYYPYIINNAVLGCVDFRAMNLHPSLLPEYKGCFSAPWVIINGEKQAGITYHYITAEIDKGNIILQSGLIISPDDTGYSLYHKLITLGVTNFLEAFTKLLAGDPGQVQAEGGEYYKRDLPYGGYLDLSWSDEQIARFIRAMYFPPFKGAMLKVEGNEDLEFLTIEEYLEYKKTNQG